MKALPGYNRFFIGNASLVKKYQRTIETSKRPHRVFTTWFNQFTNSDQPGNPPYDAGEHPVLVTNFGAKVFLWVADPDMLQDLYVTKNSHYDKTGELAKCWSKFLGEAFLFSQANETWKAKRKACAHAFYKDRLIFMLDALKDKLAN